MIYEFWIWFNESMGKLFNLFSNEDFTKENYCERCNHKLNEANYCDNCIGH